MKGKDDRFINGCEHLLLTKKSSKDGNQVDNGREEPDKSEENDIEGKYFKAEFKTKQTDRELTGRKKLLMT